MEARRKEIWRKTWVVSRTPHALISVDLQTYLKDKICLFKVPWNLFPAWEEAAKYPKRNCNNRRMLCEVREPLFLVRRLTLRPSMEETSDKSQTLEGVTLEQKTPNLIYIWTLQGSLVDLSIYIFEFVRCSEKKWEVGETCAASRGIFIFQFSSLFHTCYCNAPAIFKYSVPKQQTTASAILSVISGNGSNEWGGVKNTFWQDKCATNGKLLARKRKRFKTHKKRNNEDGTQSVAKISNNSITVAAKNSIDYKFVLFFCHISFRPFVLRA